MDSEYICNLPNSFPSVTLEAFIEFQRSVFKDEESDSEQAETLHLSSLSWLGADLEIQDKSAKENLVQKYTRLRCEVIEFSEELNRLAQEEGKDNLTGLHKQVIQLQEQLANCLVDQDPAATPAVQQQELLENLRQRITDISKGSKDGGARSSGSYDLYLQLEQSNASESLALMDQRLARLEKLVGPAQLAKRRVLSVGTDNLALVDALEFLDSRKYTLAPEHLSHVEGRLAALALKLNSLKEQKDKVDAAKTATEVSLLFASLENRAGVVTVLPEMIERLEDLKELHQASSGWNSRISDISSDQEKTETLLAENEKEVDRTRSLLADGLKGVTSKLEKLQASLQTLKA